MASSVQNGSPVDVINNIRSLIYVQFSFTYFKAVPSKRLPNAQWWFIYLKVFIWKTDSVHRTTICIFDIGTNSNTLQL